MYGYGKSFKAYDKVRKLILQYCILNNPICKKKNPISHVAIFIDQLLGVLTESIYIFVLLKILF